MYNFLCMGSQWVIPQDVRLERNYDREPIIIITPRHNSEGNNLKPIYMSVAAWIEVLLAI